jgi:HAD superfamily hydrolase (TIGR01549 family)
MLKLILFDFDGTLVDSMHHYANLAATLFAQHYSLPYDQARSDYLKTSGIAFTKQLEILFPENPLNSQVEQLFAAGKITIKNKIDWCPYVIQLLNALKKAGYKIGISSSEDEENIIKFMQKKSIYWDVLLGTRDPVFTKGMPHFTYITEHYGLKPENLLFIGDSLQDFKISAANNVPFIAYLSTFSEADFHQLHPKIPCYSNYERLHHDLIKGDLLTVLHNILL